MWEDHTFGYGAVIKFTHWTPSYKLLFSADWKYLLSHFCFEISNQYSRVHRELIKCTLVPHKKQSSGVSHLPTVLALTLWIAHQRLLNYVYCIVLYCIYYTFQHIHTRPKPSLYHVKFVASWVVNFFTDWAPGSGHSRHPTVCYSITRSFIDISTHVDIRYLVICIQSKMENKLSVRWTTCSIVYYLCLSPSRL
jgi:hypothetical protein